MLQGKQLNSSFYHIMVFIFTILPGKYEIQFTGMGDWFSKMYLLHKKSGYIKSYYLVKNH